MTKEVVGQIDSLMNLYSLPPSEKTEYRDDSETLMNKVFTARRFFRAATGAPTPNGQNAINNAERQAGEVLEGINAFFGEDWKEYVEKVKSLPMEDLFKVYEEIKLE